MKIALFYHCLFYHGNPPTFSDNACEIVQEQMRQLQDSGLLDAASEMIVGINGGKESLQPVIPEKAKVVLHGLESKAENLTLVEIEKWVPKHPDWHVLYFHVKGATHDCSTEYGRFCARWRRCMMGQCVTNWRNAIAHLDAGFDAVGCHWLTGMGEDKSQHYFAGNFWWATSNFLSTVPSIFLRDRIKLSGIASVESRYEAEVWIGNGKLPKIKDLETAHGLGQCP